MTLHFRVAMNLCQVEKKAIIGNGEGNPDRRGWNRVQGLGSDPPYTLQFNILNRTLDDNLQTTGMCSS